MRLAQLKESDMPKLKAGDVITKYRGVYDIVVGTHGELASIQYMFHPDARPEVFTLKDLEGVRVLTDKEIIRELLGTYKDWVNNPEGYPNLDGIKTAIEHLRFHGYDMPELDTIERSIDKSKR